MCVLQLLIIWVPTLSPKQEFCPSSGLPIRVLPVFQSNRRLLSGGHRPQSLEEGPLAGLLGPPWPGSFAYTQEANKTDWALLGVKRCIGILSCQKVPLRSMLRFALRCVALLRFTLRSFALHRFSLHCFELPYFGSLCFALPCFALMCLALHCFALH